jgi:hypothetical protein
VVSLSYATEDGRLVTLELDATLSEAHAHTAKVTEFPVETGATISDHVIQAPDVVKLEGVVSNAPLPSNVKRDAETFDAEARAGAYAQRGEDVYWQFLEAKEAGLLVTVSTELRAYTSMVIESLEPVKEGDAVRVTATLKKVVTSTTATVPVPKTDQGQAKRTKGRQPTTQADAPTAEKADSVARSMKEWFAR